MEAAGHTRAAGQGQAPRRTRWRKPSLGTGKLSDGIREIGSMVVLTRATVWAALRPPYSYGAEFASQFLFGLRMAWFRWCSRRLRSRTARRHPGRGLSEPLRRAGPLGGLFALVVMREFAPLVCAIVISGVVGTAICADLGAARKIREELDALMVLGIDPIKSLVVPRFLAVMALTTLLDIFALVLGTFGGMLATLTHGAPLGPFFATYFANATTTEFAASLLKTTIFGAIIAIVCCYNGLTAKAALRAWGARSNQAVRHLVPGIGAVNYVFTQTVLALYPELSQLR